MIDRVFRLSVIIMLISLVFSCVYSQSDLEHVEIIEYYENIIDSRKLIDADLEMINEYIEDNSDDLIMGVYKTYLEGIIMVAKSDYENGIRKFDKALKDARKIKNNELVMIILNRGMDISLHLVRIDHLINNGVELAELAEEYDNPYIESFSKISLAYGYYFLGDNKSAMRLLREGIDIATEHEYNDILAKSYDFLGDVRLEMKEYSYAKINYQTALSLMKKNPGHSLIGNEHDLLEAKIALTDANLGDVQGAIERIDQILTKESSVNYDNLMIYYNIKGFIYFKAGDYKRSIELFESAREFEGKIKAPLKGNRYSIIFLSYFADAYYLSGDYESAADVMKEIISFQTDPRNAMRVNRIYSDIKEFEFSEIEEELELVSELNEVQEERLKFLRYFVIISVGAIILLSIIIFLIIKEAKERAKNQEILYIQSITDKLTGVYNRGRIIEIFESKLKEKTVVALLDLDDFKLINDNFGHLTGDEVLRKVSYILKESIRENDFVGRYGGEEFMIVFDNISVENAMIVAERVRSNIESIRWEYENLRTTISIGLSVCFSQDADEVLHEVDQLMYKAKHKGKNRIEMGVCDEV